jgi:hypothetical protein
MAIQSDAARRCCSVLQSRFFLERRKVFGAIANLQVAVFDSDVMRLAAFVIEEPRQPRVLRNSMLKLAPVVSRRYG